MGAAICHIHAQHPAADGHFTGNPIIPGAVLLQEVEAAVAATRPGEVCKAVASAKFLHPVRPGDTLQIDWTEGVAGAIRFTCRTRAQEAPVLIGALQFGPP